MLSGTRDRISLLQISHISSPSFHSSFDFLLYMFLFIMLVWRITVAIWQRLVMGQGVPCTISNRLMKQIVYRVWGLVMWLVPFSWFSDGGG